MSQTLIARVEEALDTIRPYLEADGGNAKIVDVTEDGIAKVELLGACGSCPMSAMTLKAGIEQAIINAVPEVKKVEAINMEEFEGNN
ncbi:NifU family protein [Flammeovirga yaeyamensis]|uniref:NifU family protein n=1 Tax=Flammeovirga yaeyamensis TaxID=367791 RepID=A0AAX1N9X6_9BACT|nr:MULTISPECIES: NifU family protein [Flammeovirga]ANQ49774.1 NifU family protein [Flammeovirga sp. MY04]MBB3697364.1 Fe-S cluster biogenesis protein NfuA [Flammeovirga yaeyamensis]NMF36058.1 NifU family protein [Flammeovirga yaeyamensis]QWG02793.1 NifU family protein [Flammeovirga yaeyamensis]